MLSQIFEAEASPTLPVPILPHERVVAAVTWGVESKVRTALCGTPNPAGCPEGLLFVPESVRTSVLQWGHSSGLACHPGATRTCMLIKQRFWWPSVARDARLFVSACPVCAAGKASNRPPAGLLQPLSVPSRPWSHIAMDFVTGLPPSGGMTVYVRPGARAGDSAHHEGASYGCVSMEWSSAPCTTAEGELIIHLGLLDLEEDLINWETDLEIELPPLLSPSSPLVPSSPPSSLVPLSNPEEAPNTPVPTPRKCPPVHAPRKCPPVPALQKCPPSHRSYLLHRCRLAASPLALSPLSVRCEPRGTAILQHRSPPPTASEARTPPRPVDPAAPPRLIAPLPPPSPVDPPALPGSLVPPVLPWSGVDPPSPLDSSPLAVSRRCSVSFVYFWMSSLCVYRCPLPFGSLKTVIITCEDLISKET